MPAYQANLSSWYKSGTWRNLGCRIVSSWCWDHFWWVSFQDWFRLWFCQHHVRICWFSLYQARCDKVIQIVLKVVITNTSTGRCITICWCLWFRDSLLVLRVFYNEMFVTSITQQPQYTLASLFCKYHICRVLMSHSQSGNVWSSCFLSDHSCYSWTSRYGNGRLFTNRSQFTVPN